MKKNLEILEQMSDGTFGGNDKRLGELHVIRLSPIL